MYGISTKAILAAIGALILFGYISALNIRISSLKNDVVKANNRYDTLVNETTAAGLKQKAETLAIEQNQKKVTLNTALGFNDALSRQKAYYENKLTRNRVIPHSVQQQSASSDAESMPSATTGSGRANEGAAHVTLDRPGEPPEVTEEECAETTLQLLWMQDWAVKQGLYLHH
jgi:hypothetical protein